MSTAASPKTFLIISLPHVEEEDVRRLEIEYVTVTRELSEKERLFLKLCTEEPYWSRDNTRGGGSEQAMALYLLSGQKRPIKWQTQVLVESIPAEEDSFTLYDIDTLDALRAWWSAELVPKHDVCLIGQIVRECFENGDETLGNHVAALQIMIDEQTQWRKNKRTQLTDIQRQIVELDADYLYQESEETTDDSDFDGESDESSLEPTTQRRRVAAPPNTE